MPCLFFQGLLQLILLTFTEIINYINKNFEIVLKFIKILNYYNFKRGGGKSKKHLNYRDFANMIIEQIIQFFSSTQIIPLKKSTIKLFSKNLKKLLPKNSPSLLHILFVICKDLTFPIFHFIPNPFILVSRRQEPNPFFTPKSKISLYKDRRSSLNFLG